MTTTITHTGGTIWLASGSPRRRELLTQVGFRPLVQTSDVPEELAPNEGPEDYTLRLAEAKARAVMPNLGPESAWVLAADTVVVDDSRILEKPSDKEDAFRMLKSLQGRAHRVVTGFCVASTSGDVLQLRSVSTAVHFLSHDDSTLRRYVATGEPMDKAGAYGIQGIGAFLVDRVEGCYNNVVGLPVSEVLAVLKDANALGPFPFSTDAT